MQIPAVLHADAVHDEHMNRRDEMRPHFQHEDGQCQEGGKDDAFLQLCRFRIPLFGLGFLFVAALPVIKRPRLIAGSFNGLDKLVDRHLPGQIDMRPLRCKVDAGAGHARHAVQSLFDLADAGRAAHALDGQIDAGGGHFIARLANGIDHRRQIRRALESHVGAFRCEIDGHLVDARNLGDSFFHGRHA